MQLLNIHLLLSHIIAVFANRPDWKWQQILLLGFRVFDVLIFNVQFCLSFAGEKCELPVGCVLERILTTQGIDKLDIDGVFPLHLQLEKYMKENSSAR